MTVTGHEDEFRLMFQEEATARLSDLVKLTHTLRAGPPPDAELLDTMHRQAHTLHGGAGVVGFYAIADEAERLARLIDEVRTRRRAADPAFADAVLAAVKDIRSRLASER